MPTMRVNGVELYYEDTGGSHPPIVFAHGLLWSGRMFDAQVTTLRDRYRCVTFDFRGQGRSAVTRDGYDMDTLSQDATALMVALGLAPCHFAGLSMGGFIGMRLAARRPELLRSLILLETAADAEPPANVRRYRQFLLVERLLGPGVVAGRVMPIMFGHSFMHDPARAAERVAWQRRLAANDRVGVQRATIGVIERLPIENELGQIKIPTLVIEGDEDTAVPLERAKRTAACIPGARLVMIPRAGHTSSVEEPAAVTAAIENFLRSL
jgi:pimeloyl-ACP methyl ester carboxylesterase